MFVASGAIRGLCTFISYRRMVSTVELVIRRQSFFLTNYLATMTIRALSKYDHREPAQLRMVISLCAWSLISEQRRPDLHYKQKQTHPVMTILQPEASFDEKLSSKPRASDRRRRRSIRSHDLDTTRGILELGSKRCAEPPVSLWARLESQAPPRL